GRVVAVENDFVIIDVGLKTEGRVALKEFSQPDKDVAIKAGDTVEVYLERIENALGEAVLSRDKARREEAWTRLEEMSTKNERVNHPSDVLTVGQTLKVQIVRINPETQRISLGMKQLDKDPWELVSGKYPIGSRVRGKVTNITDYGAFIELEDGIEGLVHVSE